MLSLSKDPMWQQAFLACDELDVKQKMPLVTKPNGVATSLKVFPSGSASVAKLLAEGPRDELSSSSKDTPKGVPAPPAPHAKGKAKAKTKTTEKKASVDASGPKPVEKKTEEKKPDPTKMIKTEKKAAGSKSNAKKSPAKAKSAYKSVTSFLHKCKEKAKFLPDYLPLQVAVAPKDDPVDASSLVAQDVEEPSSDMWAIESPPTNVDVESFQASVEAAFVKNAAKPFVRVSKGPTAGKAFCEWMAGFPRTK